VPPRTAAHGSVWFKEPDIKRIKELMLYQSSAKRAAYQFHQHTGKSGNEVKIHVKTNYLKDLNQRYVSDACTLALAIEHDQVIFGGKRSWRDLQRGKITKEEWQRKRNNQLYSCGDRAKKGNPNIRVVGDELWVNDPSKRSLWIKGKVWFPDKFYLELDCYDARLIWNKDGSLRVVLTWEYEPCPIRTRTKEFGVVGIDTNPDGFGLARTNGDGNLVEHRYIGSQRLAFASTSKRDHDIRMLAIEVVDYALEHETPIVIEDLDFGKRKKKKGKRFNRMAHNFPHQKMLEAVKSRAVREGVEIIEVSAAYTSILGLLKYADMYSLNRHIAAALVIARRGMGIQERQTFTAQLRGRGGSKVNLEGRTRKQSLRRKSWTWLWNGMFLKPNQAGLTARAPVPRSKRGKGVSTGGIPVGKSPPSITGRRGSPSL
jgi:IS605 OrfB family transposase